VVLKTGVVKDKFVLTQGFASELRGKIMQLYTVLVQEWIESPVIQPGHTPQELELLFFEYFYLSYSGSSLGSLEIGSHVA
jgi:hypothetical protein